MWRDRGGILMFVIGVVLLFAMVALALLMLRVCGERCI
jgi:hypothetical protein